MKYTLQLFFILTLLNTFSIDLGAQSINNEIISINELRKNHFELGNPLDTTKIAEFIKSKNPSIRNFSLLIKTVYDLEYFRYWSDKKLVDLIQNKKWLNDSTIINYKYLIIDDLFRVCMASKRYMLFHHLNFLLFHDNPTNLISYSYETYINLKSGNTFKFLNNQSLFKSLIIRDIDSFHSQVSSEVFDRLKFNIISIGFANYDTLNKLKFYAKLENYVNKNIDTTTNFENIFFSYEFTSYSGDSIRFKLYEPIMRSKLSFYYCSPFILNISYINFLWNNTARDYLKKILFIKDSNAFKYSKGIVWVQSLEFYNKDFDEFNQDANKRYNVYGKFDNNSMMNDELERKIPDLFFIDSLLNLNYFYEPNWLYFQLNLTLKGGLANRTIESVISARNLNKNDATASKIKDEMVKFYNRVKKNDFTNFVDGTNFYFAPYELLDFYEKNNNKVLESDTTNYQFYDSIYKILLFCKTANYFQTNSSIDKTMHFNGILVIKNILDNIFISSKNYNAYSEFNRLTDISQYYTDTIPDILQIIKDKYRYLNFIETSERNQISLFDSLYLSQLKIYLDIPNFDKIRNTNHYHFYTNTSKNIILDIYNRGMIKDSLLISYLYQLDVNQKIISRLTDDLSVYNQANDSSNYISTYKNSYFCIDNNEMNLFKSNDTLNYVPFEDSKRFINREILIDSNMKVLCYFTADNYSLKNENGEKINNYDSTQEYIYVVYSDINGSKFKKLITLDSLNKIINIHTQNSLQFFNTSYFNKINVNSKILYDIFLSSIEKYIDSNNIYKIILPSNLISLPLDYIFGKEKGFLPHFEEYSDLTRISYNRQFYLSKNDTINVFSDMVYNDIYCNINKATSPDFRSGILELKYSNIEREEIRKSIPIKSFIRLDASKLNFMQTLINKNSSNIHLITHGAYMPMIDFNQNDIHSNYNRSPYNFPEIPQERQLLLFSSDSTNFSSKNNLLVSYEIRYLTNLSHIKFIYLSACETGLIDDNSSNKIGYSGFVKELLDRGVNSVIATRWKVQDKEASSFASEFYKNLYKYKGYSEAFYKTKLNYFKNSSNPLIWTSYIFVK
jgi:CHAT domain-containing protein